MMTCGPFLPYLPMILFDSIEVSSKFGSIFSVPPLMIYAMASGLQAGPLFLPCMVVLHIFCPIFSQLLLLFHLPNIANNSVLAFMPASRFTLGFLFPHSSHLETSACSTRHQTLSGNCTVGCTSHLSLASLSLQSVNTLRQGVCF